MISKLDVKSLLDLLHKSVSQEEQLSKVLQGSMTSAFFSHERFITWESSTEEILNLKTKEL